MSPATLGVHRALLSTGSRRVAVGVMLGSLVFPVEGVGVSLCAVHAATGLPCPGCGMTRALAAVSQGELSTALALHPFVVVVWPVALALAVLAFSPAAVRDGLARRLDRAGDGLERLYRVVLVAFLGFGVLRFAALLAAGARFP